MRIDDVKKRAFAMPLTNPSYPSGPYRFVNREFFIITYRTDMDALQRIVPEPLEVKEPIVKYEFIRMPDSTGFGDYTETGQVIPVTFRNQPGATFMPCILTMMHRSLEGARSGAFLKNSLPRRCALRRTHWLAH